MNHLNPNPAPEHSNAPFLSDPDRGLFATRAPGHAERPTDHYLIAKLERRMEVPFTSLDDSGDSPGSESDDGLLLVIAGGIDSHGEGEHASRLAVESIRDYLVEQVSWAHGPDAESERRLERSLEASFLHAEACLRSPTEPDRRLLSSLTVACIFWPRMFIAHAGDGRAFRVRNERCERLTRVHTVAQDFVDKGILTPDEASTSRFQNVIWNSVGGRAADVRPEINKYTLEAGDRLLLASDGLARSISRKKLRDVMIGAPSAPSAAGRLIGASDGKIAQDRTALVAFFPEKQPVSVPISVPVENRAGARRSLPFDRGFSTATVGTRPEEAREGTAHVPQRERSLACSAPRIS